MLISKFDLYRPEWLELVFDHRNKEYGAYELRQHYAGNMIRAMGITFLGIGLLFGLGSILKSNPPVITTTTHVDVAPRIIVVPPPTKPIKKIEPPAPVKAKPVATTKFVPLVVKPDPDITDKAPKVTEITVAIAQSTSKGTQGGQVLPVVIDPGPGTVAQPDNTVHGLAGLDFMPEPVGGADAWNKFLSKNLRYPAAAQEDGVSGRVILSFVIEKDGRLSNIVVEQGAGHGFDEEALRVLKLAKAWKPGVQNGQPVRVRYLIPINFQLSQDN